MLIAAGNSPKGLAMPLEIRCRSAARGFPSRRIGKFESTPLQRRVADDVLSKGETDIQDIAEEIETGATKDPACRMATAESLALHFLRQYRWVSPSPVVSNLLTCPGYARSFFGQRLPGKPASIFLISTAKTLNKAQ